MPFAHSLLKGKARRGNSSYPIDHLWYLINILIFFFFFSVHVHIFVFSSTCQGEKVEEINIIYMCWSFE